MDYTLAIILLSFWVLFKKINAESGINPKVNAESEIEPNLNVEAEIKPKINTEAGKEMKK